MNIVMNNGTKIYYPRKMRTGWCVAHEIIAAGVKMERFGTKYRTYQEAYQAAERMNSNQLPGDGNNRQEK